jgi:UDP-glucose:(heptosyl)LPS alpha-1,3-glucosyltransferase
MRIGLVVERLDPQAGGVEHWTCQFARSLVALGHQVHVVASRFAAETGSWGIERHALGPHRSRTAFADAAAGHLARLRLDVVHDTGAGYACDVFQPHGGSRIASFEQNLLLVPRWLRPIKRRLAQWLPRYREFTRLAQRQYARDGRIVLALSNMVAQDLKWHYGVPPEQLRIVYNGVDVDRFAPSRAEWMRGPVRRRLRVRNEELLLLIVAHNFALKGVATVIRAVGRLLREGIPVRLAVAGGKRAGRYCRLAVRCGAGDAVEFLGSVDDAAPLYAAADVYVQPTWYDPCSLVVLEALATGRPVITSRYNGAGELITEGVEGHVLGDPGDCVELAARVRGLLDPAVRQCMGAAARALALEHTLSHNVSRIVAVYDEIAQRRRRKAA